MFEKLDLLLPEEVFSGPMQMALDEVLLKATMSPILRIYQWEAHCISFGYFQKHLEVRRLHSDLPAVRRWTGGGIVKHGSDLTFSLMIPKAEPATLLPPAIFYHKLHALLAKLLQSFFGSEIRIAGEAHVLQGASCFTAPVRDDLLLEGRKILGGAQRRSAGALLYQGSLQGIEITLSRETLAMQMNLPLHLASALSSSVSQITLAEEQMKAAFDLVVSRYGSESWNERR